jgi:hypothetical protein
MSIDEDKSGTITVEEMRKALQSWGHKINEVELKQLMQIADVDGDGLIDYNEVRSCRFACGCAASSTGCCVQCELIVNKKRPADVQFVGRVAAQVELTKDVTL